MLEIVELLSNGQVFLLHNGKLVAEGDLESLRSQVGEERLSNIFLKVIELSEEPASDGAAV